LAVRHCDEPSPSQQADAHDEGKTQLNGRTVERIRMDAPTCPSGFPNCPREPAYAHVDPETFHPVQIDSPHGYIIGTSLRFDGIIRIFAYEYLPRTPANLELADIEGAAPERHPLETLRTRCVADVVRQSAGRTRTTLRVSRLITHR
jgi:hypothetical protein